MTLAVLQHIISFHVVTNLFNAPLHKYVLIITGYSVVSHNRTITSSQKGATALVNQQQSSVTAAADDDKVRDYQ